LPGKTTGHANEQTAAANQADFSPCDPGEFRVAQYDGMLSLFPGGVVRITFWHVGLLAFTSQAVIPYARSKQCKSLGGLSDFITANLSEKYSEKTGGLRQNDTAISQAVDASINRLGDEPA
jgi:hypothetical protein